MHILTVLDHPNPNSFTAAAVARFSEGARAAGHTTELADLHSEGFDPRWTMADVEEDLDSGGLADVLAEQERILRADAICLAFPLYWWGMPAMTKGWVDRVFMWGWAYDQLGQSDVSLLRPRSGLLLVPAGMRSNNERQRPYVSALEAMWLQGTFGYFGFSPREMKILYGATGSDERRAGLLEECYAAGLHMPAAKLPDLSDGPSDAQVFHQG